MLMGLSSSPHVRMVCFRKSVYRWLMAGVYSAMLSEENSRVVVFSHVCKPEIVAMFT